MLNLEDKKAVIMAAAQAEIVKAEQQCALLESLPIQPDFVHIYSLYGSIGSVKYNATSDAHALEIINAFPDVSPSYICRNGTTVSVRATDDEKTESVQECFAIVEIERRKQSIRFYWQSPIGLVRVEVVLACGTFGQYVVQDAHRRKYYKWVFRPANKLGALLRVASYAQTEQYGEYSGGHYLYAAFERFEIADLLSN